MTTKLHAIVGDGGTYNMAIGQGFTTVTVLQMAIATAAIANDGAMLMVAKIRLDYRLIDALGWVAYCFGIVVLVAVLFLGREEFGSRRWIDLGFTVVQASEIGKLMTISGLARFLTNYGNRLQEFRIFLLSLGIAALPGALAFIEPDVGSGGLWGQGLTEGTQTQLDFVRIQTTDFIFSVLSEELGLVGAMALLLLFLLLLSRKLRVANKAGELSGQFLAVGLLSITAIQVLINVAINIRLIPVTGIPLPFLSTCNSSLLVFFVGLGLLQSVLAWQDDARDRRRPATAALEQPSEALRSSQPLSPASRS